MPATSSGFAGGVVAVAEGRFGPACGVAGAACPYKDAVVKSTAESANGKRADRNVQRNGVLRILEILYGHTLELRDKGRQEFYRNISINSPTAGTRLSLRFCEA
jgi:hypothetical protein